jgi:hypothetical protein
LPLATFVVSRQESDKSQHVVQPGGVEFILSFVFVSSFPLFFLTKKVDQKSQGKTIPIAIGSSARFAMAHAQVAPLLDTSFASFSYFLLRSRVTCLRSWLWALRL